MTTFKGVPVGTQIAWLSWSSTGTPPANTRVAPMIHWAGYAWYVGIGPTRNGHPAITYGAVWVTTVWPPTVTLGNGTVG